MRFLAAVGALSLLALAVFLYALFGLAKGCDE